MLLWNDKPYHSLDYELRQIYGEKIYKIALDAGMTCPNRDGTCGTRGCIFCSAGGSGEFAAGKTSETISIAAQLEQGRQYFRGKNTGRHFIAYFQAYTNTYAPVARLETLYREALDEPSVVGISIATRPDCLGDDVLSLLDRFNREYPDKLIWIELGLQTIHESTAVMIRRGYPLAVFEQAVIRLRERSIPIIAHVIIGLPGEDKPMMLETCRFLADTGISGIKLQLLHVLSNTDLVELYKKKTFDILGMMEYIDIIISCLEVLPPDMVVHRVTGDGPRNLLLAPLWSLDKRRVLNTLHQEMRKRGTWQSKSYEAKQQNPKERYPMAQDPLTLYKLIVLYMLNKVNFKLSYSQISSFLLEKEYTSFMTLQEVISDLQETELIKTDASMNRTFFSITDEGRSTLSYFENRIGDAIIADIDAFLSERHLELRNEASITAKYYKATSGEYEAELTAREKDVELVNIRISVPAEDMAETICESWYDKNEQIYKYLMETLF